MAGKDRIINKMAVITAFVLCSIIILQIYWLVASYQQQKNRFKEDVESAIGATLMKWSLKKIFSLQNNEGPGTVDMHAASKELDQLAYEKEYQQRNVNIHINLDVKMKDTARLMRVLDEKNRQTQRAAYGREIPQVRVTTEKSDLPIFRMLYQEELSKKGINIPFELALVDSNGRYRMATCDTNTFKNFSVRSDFNKRITGPLMVAFPDGGSYLFKKVMWLLIVTLVLIVIGVFSFAYLMIMYFRQKKIAVIRNDFMNNMTHELKTPISSINVVVDMMLDKGLDLSEDKKVAYLQAAQKESLRLNSLVENTLDIISLENGTVTLEEEPIVLVPFITDIVTRLSPIVDKKEATINIADDVHNISITADKIHMCNALQNIIENALKYNDKSKPVVDIHVSAEADGISIKIADNGPGIPQKYLDKVFDKFFRVPTGNLHEVKGYGLGLSYVKKIVEMHGGTITVESIPKSGSIFIIYLPKL